MWATINVLFILPAYQAGKLDLVEHKTVRFNNLYFDIYDKVSKKLL